MIPAAYAGHPGRLVISADVLMREVDEEAVLLNLATEAYFGLDEVGTRMWYALTECGSLAAAFERLAAEFDVEPARLEADLRSLLQQLLSLGLVETRDV
jgi:hypothetical protein